MGLMGYAFGPQLSHGVSLCCMATDYTLVPGGHHIEICYKVNPNSFFSFFFFLIQFYNLESFFFFSFVFAVLMSCESSWARD